MLVSIALGLFILCVVYVAYWSVKNDAAKSIDDQGGFLRMRRPKSPRVPPAKRGADAMIRQADKPAR
jgi:hypothetical protein